MKLWLDDMRKPPNASWTWVTTVEAAKWYLHHETVEVASLDNDLGEGQPEGRTLVRWMAERQIWPQHVEVHSSNVPAADYMRAMIERYMPKLTAAEVAAVGRAFTSDVIQRIAGGDLDKQPPRP
jgi:hypothetical protein